VFLPGRTCNGIGRGPGISRWSSARLGLLGSPKRGTDEGDEVVGPRRR
jgi:hypothetical protein